MEYIVSLKLPAVLCLISIVIWLFFPKCKVPVLENDIHPSLLRLPSYSTGMGTLSHGEELLHILMSGKNGIFQTQQANSA